MLIDYANCELFDDLQVRDIETGAVAVLLMISGYGLFGSYSGPEVGFGDPKPVSRQCPYRRRTGRNQEW